MLRVGRARRNNKIRRKISRAIGRAFELERFPAKWRQARVKKTRQIKNLEPRFDSIETEKL